MKKLRRMQNINNIVMTISFMVAIGSLLAGSILGFLLGGIACLCTFVAEKKIEKARRIILSSDPITNILRTRG